jgi:hypothetical protein
VAFLAGRTWFMEFAHPISAITMFAFLGANALINGYNLYVTRKPQEGAPADERKREVGPFNAYTAIGTLMLLAALVITIFVRPHLNQWVFGLEAVEIGLFAVFWLRQRVELWNEGLRPVPAAVREQQQHIAGSR